MDGMMDTEAFRFEYMEPIQLANHDNTFPQAQGERVLESNVGIR